MQIVDRNLAFKGSHSRRLETIFFVIHHTAGADVNSQTVHQMHLNKGWNGIGYHYLITGTGTIERGRPEWAIGAHSKPVNNRSIGIALAGDFTKHRPTQKQYQSLAWLLKDLQKRYPAAKIVGHADTDATLCPGHLFEWQKVRELMSDDPKVFPKGYPLQNVVIRGQAGNGVNVDGVICIPAREVARLLGATVEWNATTKTVTIR